MLTLLGLLYIVTVGAVLCSDSEVKNDQNIGELFLRGSKKTSDLVVVVKAFDTLKEAVRKLENVVGRLKGDGSQCGEGSKNYALGKPATQSSVYSLYGKTPLLASLATDGNRGANPYKIEVAITNKNNNPWWKVDLRQDILVSRVVIQNRHDCCGSRLKHIRVTVGSSNSHMKLCATFPGPGYDGQLVTLWCDKPVRGRYVVIQQMYKEHLQLAEVEVYSD